jgi:hypothetical protein
VVNPPGAANGSLKVPTSVSRDAGATNFIDGGGGKASNNSVVVCDSPSREEKLLSDHVFSIFGRTITITSQEELLAIVAIAVLATAWAVRLFRRKRTVVVQRSAVSDQMLYELSRIADALERIANRPADEAIAAVSRRLVEKPPANPLSIFGRERPQG